MAKKAKRKRIGRLMSITNDISMLVHVLKAIDPQCVLRNLTMDRKRLIVHEVIQRIHRN